MMASYNTSFWPMPLVNYSLSVVAVVITLRRSDYASRVVAGVLVLFWLWTGVVFNGLVLSGLSSRAVVFAVIFVIQGILLALTGVTRQSPIRRGNFTPLAISD